MPGGPLRGSIAERRQDTTGLLPLPRHEPGVMVRKDYGVAALGAIRFRRTTVRCLVPAPPDRLRAQPGPGSVATPVIQPSASDSPDPSDAERGHDFDG